MSPLAIALMGGSAALLILTIAVIILSIRLQRLEQAMWPTSTYNPRHARLARRRR